MKENSTVNKYLSIITNFGCHYTCPYCIVKENNLKIPKTTIKGLHKLLPDINKYCCDIISVSGGGDPLHNYEENKDWWDVLFKKADSYHLPIEIHTSYIDNLAVNKLAAKTKRMVYHLRDFSQLEKIKRFGDEIIRVVYVVTKDFTLQQLMDISLFVKNSDCIDELSFRQMVNEDYQEEHYLEDYLKLGYKKLWYYIEQNDYNLYYAENKIYTSFEEFN